MAHIGPYSVLVGEEPRAHGVSGLAGKRAWHPRDPATLARKRAQEQGEPHRSHAAREGVVRESGLPLKWRGVHCCVPIHSLRIGRGGTPPQKPLMRCFTGHNPQSTRIKLTRPQLSWGKLQRKPATRRFDWPFTPMPRSDYTICTSGQLPASITVSHDFAVTRYSSPPFGSHGTRWHSEPCPLDSGPVALAGRPPHENGESGCPPSSCPHTDAFLQSPKQRMVNTVGSFAFTMHRTR